MRFSDVLKWAMVFDRAILVQLQLEIDLSWLDEKRILLTTVSASRGEGFSHWG